jgi:hypothetical protein
MAVSWMTTSHLNDLLKHAHAAQLKPDNDPKSIQCLSAQYTLSSTGLKGDHRRGGVGK